MFAFKPSFKQKRLPNDEFKKLGDEIYDYLGPKIETIMRQTLSENELGWDCSTVVEHTPCEQESMG